MELNRFLLKCNSIDFNFSQLFNLITFATEYPKVKPWDESNDCGWALVKLGLTQINEIIHICGFYKANMIFFHPIIIIRVHSMFVDKTGNNHLLEIRLLETGFLSCFQPNP